MGNSHAEWSKAKKLSSGIWKCLCGRVASKIHLSTLILTRLWLSDKASMLRLNGLQLLLEWLHCFQWEQWEQWDRGVVVVAKCKRTLTKALCTNLIELIDQTDSFVGEDQCPGLQRPFPGHWVPLHVRRQTHRGRTLSRRENDAGTSLLDVLEELWLGCARVPAQQNVYVTSDFVFTAWNKNTPSDKNAFQ